MYRITFGLSHPDARKPTRATDGASGYDLYSCSDRLVSPGGSAVIDTGVRLQLPAPGSSVLPEGQLLEAQVRGRSSMVFRRGLVVPLGTIDADYRGDIKVKVFNLGDTPRVIQVGERIAQLVFSLVACPVLIEGIVRADTARGLGGFGSTGKH